MFSGPSAGLECLPACYGSVAGFATHSHVCPACCSRPTAVNLSDAAHKLCAVAEKAASASGADASAVIDAVVESCEAMLEADVLANRVPLTLAQ